MVLKAKHILWSFEAKLDLNHSIHHIYLESPSRAQKLLKEIKTKVQNLKSFPEQGRIVPELELFQIFSIKELIHKHWRILYKFEQTTVSILAVLDSRRNIEDLIFQRAFFS